MSAGTNDHGHGLPAVQGFRNLEPIGEGGFARVYSAEDEILGRNVALKVLQSAADRQRFERECKVLAQLHDVDGIVPVYQATFTSLNEPVVVMRLMRGGSLAARIYPEGPLAPDEVVELGVRLASALAEANSRGVAHRDLKPQNVLFDETGQPAIADFGIAVIDSVVASSMTVAALSPPYSPPERFGDTSDVDWFVADVYSLAATLSFALTGAAPFGTAEQGGLAGLLLRISSAPPPDLRHLGLAPGFQEVLDRAMSKQPQDRYASMGQFRDALASCRPQRSEFIAPLPFPTGDLRTGTPAPAPPPHQDWTIKTDPQRSGRDVGVPPPRPEPAPAVSHDTQGKVGIPPDEPIVPGGTDDQFDRNPIGRIEFEQPDTMARLREITDPNRGAEPSVERPSVDHAEPREEPAPIARNDAPRERRGTGRRTTAPSFQADAVPNSFQAPVKHAREESERRFSPKVVAASAVAVLLAIAAGLWLLVL